MSAFNISRPSFHQHNLLISLLSQVLLLLLLLSSSSSSSSSSPTPIVNTNGKDRFDEQLLIKPLASGQIYAQFDFITTLRLNSLQIHWERHFHLFPPSIARFVVDNDIDEFHFSLTKGVWRTARWGYPIQSRSTGAELNVWFTNSVKNPEDNWKKVAGELSGRFCASINFIDQPITIQPIFSFQPHHSIVDHQPNQSRLGFYATLPPEALCTENLTPWKKLLPCFGRAGLAGLLNAIPILNSHFLSMSIDYQPICLDSMCDQKALQLRQSLAVVLNPPNQFANGKQSWSLIKLFGSPVKSSCPLATRSRILVDITRNTSQPQTSTSTLSPPPNDHLFLHDQHFAVYDLKQTISHTNTTKFNIANIFTQSHPRHLHPAAPPLTVERHLAGFTVAEGGLTTRLCNRLDQSLNVTYLEVIPWYLRIYIHTLQIQTLSPDNVRLEPQQFFYRPSKDRQRPHHLEIVLTLPPQSETVISYEFERAFLKWMEYPPDANHGVYAGPAVISVHLPVQNSNLTLANFESTLHRSTIYDLDHQFCSTQQPNQDGSSCETKFIRIHTQPLLIHLPTPDFSMPYNVICLVSTVISLAFGPIHSLTTKRASPVFKKVSNTPTTSQTTVLGKVLSLLRLK